MAGGDTDASWIVLEIARRAAAGRRFELDRGLHPQVTLGRAETNAVVIPDYHLSAEHAQLFWEDDQVIFRDLRSTNGSAVERAGRKIAVDAAVSHEITIH